MTTEEREQAIAWYQERLTHGILPGTRNMFQAALDALMAQRWIPVEEKLPEYDLNRGANAYWVAKKTRNGEWQIKIALYSDYGYATTVDISPNVTWRDWDFCQILNVTHWMPLPQPPTNDEKLEDK